MKEKTNSNSELIVISQKDLLDRVLPLVEEQGKAYQKKKTVLARKAKEGEPVATITSDGLETRNVAKKGDFIVKNKTKAGERYIVKPETFNKTYKYLKELEGVYDEYIPNKQIIAIEIKSTFFTKEKKKELYFVAPWGAKMILKENDFLVCDSNNNEIYRIAREEFFETYELI